MTSHYMVCWYYEYKGDLKEEGHLEDQDADGRIILIYPTINLIWMRKWEVNELVP